MSAGTTRKRIEIPSVRQCPDCGEVKPSSAYRRNKSRPDGLAFYCTDCYKRRDNAAYRARRAAQGRKVRERVVAPNGYKWCPGCESIKALTEWGRNRASRDGYNSYCKVCRNKRDACDYLKRTYGLTQADMSEMIEAQAGVCSICLSASAEHIDHDHATGKVRGVLCFNCNVAIGQFKDDPWLLRRAISYLDGRLIGPRRVKPGIVEITTVRGGLSEDASQVSRIATRDRPTGCVDVAVLREAVCSLARARS